MHPLIAGALVAASYQGVRDGRATSPDADLRARIAALRTPQRDAFVRVATDLGSLYGVGVVAGTLALAGRDGGHVAGRGQGRDRGGRDGCRRAGGAGVSTCIR